MSERIRTVALEASGEYGMNSTDFIAAMGSLDVSSWSNIRQIRMHIREKAKPVSDRFQSPYLAAGGWNCIRPGGLLCWMNHSRTS
jgi:hypothetical protein